MLDYIKSWLNPQSSVSARNSKDKDLQGRYTQFCKDAADAQWGHCKFGGYATFNWFASSGYVRCYDSQDNVVYCIPKTNNILFTV